MNKILWIIVIIIIAVVLWWLWQSGWDVGSLPQVPGVSEEDTTGQIQQDLEQIDLGDIDSQFESIDAELQGL